MVRNPQNKLQMGVQGVQGAGQIQWGLWGRTKGPVRNYQALPRAEESVQQGVGFRGSGQRYGEFGGLRCGVEAS